MQSIEPSFTRRQALRGGLAFCAAMALFTPGVFAQQLDETPPLEEGPFYPYGRLPLDTDNDLIIVGDSTTPAVGTISHVGGRVLDTDGNPIKDALVEIWQCDVNGIYFISDPDNRRRDKNFQGYGRFVTASDGGYRFRTIKPVPYNLRPAPHIHFKISRGKEALLTTQILIAGFPGNRIDSVYRSARDPFSRELVSADFVPVKDSKIGELSANMNLVIGRTPADGEENHQH
jgi:protocatechuate 3,4-dioxygenase, beta subunit